MTTAPTTPAPAEVPLPVVSLAPINLAGRLYRRNPIKVLRKQIEDQIGKSPETIGGALELLVAECDLRAHEWRNASAWWGRTYYLLGAPAAILATVAGATALSDAVPSFVIAILALASAGLTTLVTFLNSTANRARDLELSAAWSELADSVRMSLLDYAAKRCDADAADIADLHHTYSRVIIDVHRRKAKLLRGEIPSGEPPASAPNRRRASRPPAAPTPLAAVQR
jgi:hypothetical protein